MNLFSKEKILSIDFDSYKIKVVEGRFAKKSIYLYKSFYIDIPKGIYEEGQIIDIEQLSYLLKNGLKGNHISTDGAIGVINSTHIISRKITIPKANEKEIRAILRYQIGDYIPIDPEDYIIQFLLLDSMYEEGVEKYKILLIGVPKIIIESHFNLFKSIDLKPQVLDFQGNAIAKLIGFSDKINYEYPIKNNTISSIELGYNSTKLTLINNGVIRITRVLDKGIYHIIDNVQKIFNIDTKVLQDRILNDFDLDKGVDEKSNYYLIYKTVRDGLMEILDNIEMIFRYYITREVGNKIDLILLQGDFSFINGIDKIFIDFFDIETIKLQSLDKIDFDDDLSIYSNAIGGLIRFNEV